LLRRATADIELLAALALTLLYAAVMGGHLQNPDGILMFNQARSIVYDRSLLFREPIAEWPPDDDVDGYTTSYHGIGLSLLYVPGFVIWAGIQPFVPVDIRYPDDWAAPARDPLFTVIGAPVQLLIVAASAYLVARFCRELGLGRRAALWGMALYGLASPAIVYARQDWSQPLSGLCAIAALYAALRYRRTRHAGALVACAAILCYAVLTRPVDGALLAPAVALLVTPDLRFWRWPVPAWRAVAVLVASVAIGGAITLLINHYRFDAAASDGLSTGYEGERWTTPLWVGLPGALISPGRGILLSFPAAVLVPLGLRRLWRTQDRVVGVALATLAGLLLLNTATWYAWWGGFNWGLRLFVPALPVLAVLVACGVATLSPAVRRWLPGLLLAAGLVWAIPCIVTYINAGYGAAHAANTAAQWTWDAYPPIGAWQYFDRWRAVTLDDERASDILWLRLALRSYNLSLVPPVLLVLGALALVGRVRFLLGEPKGPGFSFRSPVTVRPRGARS